MNKAAGRPRGGSDARERILVAAQRGFAASGYASTSVRGIAREAGVDHALVSYYFGSKEGLFKAVTALYLTPGRVVDVAAQRADSEEFGVQLLRACLAAWEDPRYQEPISSLLRDAMTVPETHRLLREYLQQEIVGRLVEAAGGDARAVNRAGAVASLVAGLYFTRYVMRLEPTATMTPTEVVATYGPVLAHMLAGVGTRAGRGGYAGPALRPRRGAGTT